MIRASDPASQSAFAAASASPGWFGTPAARQVVVACRDGARPDRDQRRVVTGEARVHVVGQALEPRAGHRELEDVALDEGAADRPAEREHADRARRRQEPRPALLAERRVGRHPELALRL